jgi:hypothetical protein
MASPRQSMSQGKDQRLGYDSIEIPQRIKIPQRKVLRCRVAAHEASHELCSAVMRAAVSSATFAGSKRYRSP